MTSVTEAEWREAFTIFDTDKKGLNKEQLGTVLRSLGQNPTEAEIAELFGKVSTGGTVNADGVIQAGNMFAPTMAKTGSAEQLRSAFAIFDKEGDGFISAAEVRHIISNLGEKLGEDELDDIMRELDPNGSGKINYSSFVQIIFAKANTNPKL